MRADAVECFGSFDHRPVERITLSAHGLTAKVLTWGAVLQDLHLAGHPQPLVLGFPEFASYPLYSHNFGAIVGRVANRICRGRAPVQGRVYQLDRNFLGLHMLHGGRDGAGLRLWELGEVTAEAVTLIQKMPDGHMGFPGALTARATYRILPGPALEVEITATAEAPTLCNFAHHSYFNLDATPRALDHRLRIDCANYLEVDADLVPTGALRPVDGTAFDFRTPRVLAESGARYDLNYCLGNAREALREVAALTGPRSGLTMTVETTEPGLQLYDGAGIDTGPAPGLGGAPYGPFAGIALEPQCWPDAPNQNWAQQVQLAPGEEYRQVSVFRFGAG